MKIIIIVDRPAVKTIAAAYFVKLITIKINERAILEEPCYLNEAMK